MITGLMLLIAYILPLPIAAACFYYNLFPGDDMMHRLLMIGITSLTPSAIIMIFVLKRIVQFAFTLIVFAGTLFALQHFGLINFASSGTP
jgi:hypothetical protein